MVGGMTWRLVSRRPSPSIVRGAIERLSSCCYRDKNSDPSEPVWLAPFESTGAGTIIAPTVRLSTEELSPGDDL